MNMAHVATVRSLMEEAESGRLERSSIEYWTDPVGGRRRRVTIEVAVYDTEQVGSEGAVRTGTSLPSDPKGKP